MGVGARAGEEDLPMKTIWKFPIEVVDEQIIAIQHGAKILSVRVQHEVPYLWALVDTAQRNVLRTIRTYGTGHTISSLPDDSEYVGMLFLHDGRLVFHVFIDRQEDA